MYLLGLDVGSSSVKAAIVDASSGTALSLVQQPAIEMGIISKFPGWAEQQPEVWWTNTVIAIKKAIGKAGINGTDIASIGIAYQMHGLVLVDDQLSVLRPAIIWCDSRAVEIGQHAFDALGKNHCLSNYLNSPGNFTASKLKWVKENESDLFSKIHKVLLPGDYIAMMLSGVCNTTITGLSEGIFWDFQQHSIAENLLDHYGISKSILPSQVPSIGLQAKVKSSVAQDLGLSNSIPVSYRAGDQPNNALSLGVLQPNQVAATGGTSGVVYGVVDKLIYDNESRINSFAHVNHTEEDPRIGALLCINGAGIQYAWMRKHIAREGIAYADMEKMISDIPVGSDGLRILPFGNGAERMFNNKDVGAQINNLQFNRHEGSHLYRASLEGIAFSFIYGFQLLKDLGLDPEIIKAGNDNLFQSPVFSTTIASLLDIEIELVNTSGAIGAAKASGVGAGIYDTIEEAVGKISTDKNFYPDAHNEAYNDAYQLWKIDVEKLIEN